MGTVLGFFAPTLYRVRSRRGLLCIAFQAVEAVLIAAIAVTPLPIGAFCMAIWNFLNGFLVTVTKSLIQKQTPPHLLGRVNAFSMLASTVMLPFAQFMGSVLATAVGARSLFVVAGCIVFLGSIVGLCIPSLRRLN